MTPRHADDCDGTCGGVYECSECHLLVGYCLGCLLEGDPLNGACDDCWAAANPQTVTAP